MYAIVKTGGKQYRVSKGDVITIERLTAEAGQSIDLDQVLLISDEAGTTIGNPFIEGAFVAGTVVENGKSKKVVTFKYKAKKDYRKKQGHRQPYTMVEIKDIIKTGKKATEENDSEPAGKISLKSMKKAELIEYANTNGIEIDEKATNAVIIETIEAAMQ
jgi:large subunit ribosomal protein L21